MPATGQLLVPRLGSLANKRLRGSLTGMRHTCCLQIKDSKRGEDMKRYYHLKDEV